MNPYPVDAGFLEDIINTDAYDCNLFLKLPEHGS